MAVGKKLMADESSTPQVPGSLSLPNPASLGARNGGFQKWGYLDGFMENPNLNG